MREGVMREMNVFVIFFLKRNDLLRIGKNLF